MNKLFTVKITNWDQSTFYRKSKAPSAAEAALSVIDGPLQLTNRWARRNKTTVVTNFFFRCSDYPIIQVTSIFRFKKKKNAKKIVAIFANVGCYVREKMYF